jgi:hypothetical protein
VYSDYGLRIFPVHATEKRPMPGYGWVELASSQTNHIVEDFLRAEELWGDQVSVAWALGLDGFMAVDIDVDQAQWPEFIGGLVPEAAINQTKRGIHLVFKMPGFDCGNGTAGFPEQGWGEVRGKGGYIVIAGPDRPGLDIAQLEHAHPFPFPDWLSEYGGKTDVATKAEVIEFANEHPGPGTRPSKIESIIKACEGWSPKLAGDPRRGRHPFAIWAVTCAAEDALAGYYGFAEAVLIVKEWWKRVTPPERHSREFDGIVTWAVGKAWANAGVAPSPTVDEPEVVAAPELSLVDDITPDIDDLARFVDFGSLWDATDETVWLVERFWEQARSVLLYAKWGTGKSELTLYVAAHLALGIDPFTGEAREPIRVLYLDYEMNESDLRRQLSNFGFGPEQDWSYLHYAVYPSLPALNTKAGAIALERLLEAIEPHAVVVDTYSSASEGDENSPQATSDFNRYVLQTCHRRQVALMYLDHPGKNEKLGAMGGTRKNTQVDVVWEMSRADGGRSVKLISRKNRQGSMPKERIIERHDAEYVSFRAPAAIDEMVMTPAVVAKARQLDEAGIAPTMTRAETTAALIEAGLRPGKTSVLVDAMRYRLDRHQRGAVGHKRLELVVDNDDIDD